MQFEKDEILQVKDDINCLNSNIPILTLEEKKKRDSEYGKKRRQENPEKENDRVQKWRRDNPDKRREQILREKQKKNLTSS